MNLLFLTLAYPEGSDRNIYSDLMQEFHDRGDRVFVVCQRERRTGKPTMLSKEFGINVLRVRTGNITKTNIMEKGISTLLIEAQFKAAMNRYFGHIKFDLIIYSTPPITFEKVVKFVKNRDKSKTYLLLKDIFPQNAVDMKILKKGSLIWRYFRAKEIRLYDISDYIGCMSRANVNYVLKHNPNIDKNKVEECPNCIKPISISRIEANGSEARNKFGIPNDAVVFVYGGNLGRPQGISFLLEVLDFMKDRRDVFFLIVGSGTEYARIHNHIENESHQNVRLINYLPKADYDRMLECCDVGLIFLDACFSIPNFPSRLTAYMESLLPIAAATDINTDIKDVLREAQCGLWAKSGEVETFCGVINTLASDKNLRQNMGRNGRQYLEKYYTVSRAYEIITSHFNKDLGSINHV